MGAYNSLSSNATSNTDLLYIITVYFNPAKSKRRFQLHKEFHERLKSHPNVVLITTECAFLYSEFEVTSPNNEPYEIQIRSRGVIWIKENLINIALDKLRNDRKFMEQGKYVAWVDADIEFMDVDWFNKLVISLNKFSIVQMFKYALFLDANEKIIETHTSFGYYYETKKLKLQKNQYPHPGYAWCTTKKNILKLKKIYDKGILGSGDTHMSFAIIGKYEKGFLNWFNYEEKFKKSVKEWQNKALKVFHKNLGYVDMTIRHFWHGSRDSRQQIYRWRLLSDYNFNPIDDVIELEDGHYELNQNQKELETKLMELFVILKEEDHAIEDAPNEKEDGSSICTQKYSLSERITHNLYTKNLNNLMSKKQ